jgi:glycerol-3-phosphate O-acyltransferase / dihydroxyacetone phosphate acyltransferase
MFHSALKIILKTAVRAYYRRIDLKGLERIPGGKPVVLACNHPNAFMDAIVVAVFLERPPYFLARSDAFNTPLKNWLLSKLNLMPIYRIQEGADQLHKNTETFQKCASLLSKNATILMFPEGVCVQERRLRKLRKGLGRIVFGAEEVSSFQLNSCIVPLGINYTRPSKFNGDLVIKAGKAIEVADFIEDYKTDKARAMNSFTSKVEKEMARQVVIIPDLEDDELMGLIDQLYEQEKKPRPSAFECFKASQEISENLKHLKLSNNSAYLEIRKRTLSYFNVLSQEGFKSRLINNSVLSGNFSANYRKENVVIDFYPTSFCFRSFN